MELALIRWEKYCYAISLLQRCIQTQIYWVK